MKGLLWKLGFNSEPKKVRPPSKKMAVVPNARLSYVDHLARLSERHDVDTAMSLAVGGDYTKMGEALRARLEQLGLKANDYLIDVGCGSGRVATALASAPLGKNLRYLGLDVVPAMLEFARAKCQRPDWRFELATEPKIPEGDNCADFVCFFSVFTHLLQEESFLYLREARRVLKSGGLIAASYLDISAPGHWEIFEANVNSTKARQLKPMDIFLSPQFFAVWAERLDLEIVSDPPVQGGQRLCLLRKP